MGFVIAALAGPVLAVVANPFRIMGWSLLTWSFGTVLTVLHGGMVTLELGRVLAGLGNRCVPSPTYATLMMYGVFGTYTDCGGLHEDTEACTKAIYKMVERHTT